MARLPGKWIIRTLQIFSLTIYTLAFIHCLNVEEPSNTSLKNQNIAGGVVAQVYNPSIQEGGAEVLQVQGQHPPTV